MNQSQGTSSLCSPDLPMKRKRGRPRKDENLVHGESMSATPGPDSLKKNKHSAGTSDDVEDEMVGQVVSGVIEGSFDAGYLLNVKIGDTDTQLRGVVFLPGKFTPVTAANDVAPHMKMCKRKEIPILAVNLQSHIYGSPRPSEQSNKQPVEVKKQIPAVPYQIPPFIPQSGIPESLGSQSSSFIFPADDNLPKKEAPTLAGNLILQQPLEPGTDNQSTPVVAEQDKQDKVLVGVESTAMTGPNGVKVANTESKADVSSEAIGGAPSIESVCKDPSIQHQAVVSGSSASIPDDAMRLNFVLNQNPIFSEAAPEIADIASIETVCTATQLVVDEVKSRNLEVDQAPAFVEPAPNSVRLGVEPVCKHPEKSAVVTDVVKSPTVELNQTPVLAELALEGYDRTSKPVENLMEEDSYSAPNPSQVFGEVTVAAEHSIPSGVAKPRISSSGAVDDMECDTADVIPHEKP